MEHLRPNGQRATNAITLIWVVLAARIIMLISGYFQYELLQTVANGGEISIEAATANDVRERILAIVFLIAFVVSAVTFIQWFRRAYFNLSLMVNQLSYTDSWAAGSWFIPIVSFYQPFQIMKELYHETKDLLIKKGLDSSDNLKTSYLGWWWGLWIINILIGQGASRASMSAESIDELIRSTIANMIENIIGILLSLITVQVIKNYSSIESILSEIKNEEEAAITE